MHTQPDQGVKGEIYSVKQSDNLYLNMVKVTALNVEKWEALCYEQKRIQETLKKLKNLQSPEERQRVGEIYNQHSAVINNIEVGITGFKSSLKYYDNEKTEVWVAYASYEPVTDPNEVDIDKIEMFTTITTSENSAFTTHMGITRSVATLLAEKEPHKDLANQLHTFAAKAMLQRHPEKAYMVNVPMTAMREILSGAFEKKGMHDAVYILGDQARFEITRSLIKEVLRKQGKKLTREIQGKIKDNVYQFIFDNNLYEPLKASLLEAKIKMKKGYDEVIKLSSDRMGTARKYSTLCIEIALLEQNYSIHQKSSYIPLVVNRDMVVKEKLLENTGEVFTFILQDSSGKKLCELDATQQQGEYKWFFDHRYQFQNRNESEPLIVVDLPKLSQLKEISSNIAHQTQDSTPEEEAQKEKVLARKRQEKEEALRAQEEAAQEQKRQEQEEKNRIEQEKRLKEQARLRELQEENRRLKEEKNRIAQEKLQKEQKEQEAKRLEQENLRKEQEEKNRIEQENLRIAQEKAKEEESLRIKQEEDARIAQEKLQKEQKEQEEKRLKEENLPKEQEAKLLKEGVWIQAGVGGGLALLSMGAVTGLVSQGIPNQVIAAIAGQAIDNIALELAATSITVGLTGALLATVLYCGIAKFHDHREIKGLEVAAVFATAFTTLALSTLAISAAPLLTANLELLIQGAAIVIASGVELGTNYGIASTSAGHQGL